MAAGRIVLLNGTSSSGKSTIAGRLLHLLATPWFRMGVDDIGAMRAVQQTLVLSEDDQADVLRRTRAGFHRAVAGMAAAGNDVIVDYVLSEAWRLHDCLRVWGPYDVLFVGVHCDETELTLREQRRGDRVAGTAASQISTVHAHALYDLEVDSTDRSAVACAQTIVARVNDGEPGHAFRTLRDRLTALD